MSRGRSIASLIMMITYGHEGELHKCNALEIRLSGVLQVVSLDDPFVSLVKEANEMLILAMRTGAFLVDAIPWCKAYLIINFQRCIENDFLSQ